MVNEASVVQSGGHRGAGCSQSLLRLSLAPAHAVAVAVVDLKAQVFRTLEHLFPQLQRAAEMHDCLRGLAQLLVHLHVGGKVDKMHKKGNGVKVVCIDCVCVCTRNTEERKEKKYRGKNSTIKKMRHE